MVPRRVVKKALPMRKLESAPLVVTRPAVDLNTASPKHFHGPAPVFDCVYCAKDQLMLSKIMDKNLTAKYFGASNISSMLYQSTALPGSSSIQAPRAGESSSQLKMYSINETSLGSLIKSVSMSKKFRPDFLLNSSKINLQSMEF